jgi:hypothetical protein
MGGTLENKEGTVRRRKQKLQKQRKKQRRKRERQLQKEERRLGRRQGGQQGQAPDKGKGKLKIVLIVFAVCLLLAAIAFAAVYYLKQNENVQDVREGATLPRVSFYVDGHKVNTLAGYVAEMDIPSMRDTITPTGEDGQLQMEIEAGGQELGMLKYELRSLDGNEQYAQTTLSSIGSAEVSTVMLNLRDVLERDVRESVLVVTLQVGEREAHYYTRVARPQDLTTVDCLNFAKDFHEKAFTRKAGAELETYLEPNEKSDNTTLQMVTIHSNIYHVRWGELEPEYFTEPEWSVTESNTVYSSILAKYQVVCKGDNGGQELFNVREFFRVRKAEDEDKMYLLDYERTMNQVFTGGGVALDSQGVRLGMVEEPVSYEANEDGNIVCFVQERELWSFDKDKNQFACIFSFADDVAGNAVLAASDVSAADGGADGEAGGGSGGSYSSKKDKDAQATRGETDARCRNDEHGVRIIHVEKNGSVTFAVNGYMNSGSHEGEVGVDIFYYDAEEKKVEERAFLPSTKSFAVTEYELGKMVYYSEKNQTLYVLTGGVLYQMDVKRSGQDVLAEGLVDGQYVVSEDGSLLAWQTDGEPGLGKTVKVLDFETEETFEIKAAEGEYVKPLGFVFEDFVCGYATELDGGFLQSGEFCIPMYRLEIRSPQNKVEMEYKPDGLYVLGIEVESNLVTINRVARVDGIYSASVPDYISNNEAGGETNVVLETYSTDLKERQKRLVFQDGMEEGDVKVSWPTHVVSAGAVDVSIEKENDAGGMKPYYVFGGGRLAAVCENAGQAIRLAEELSGVVTSWKQSYVWEKGNRDLSYYVDADAFLKEEGQSSLDGCLAYMQRYGEVERMDLSGCELSQILYVVNQGMPVIVMTDTQHAVLLTGYNVETATFVDPDNGTERTVARDEMERMVAAGGNTFIGFVK